MIRLNKDYAIDFDPMNIVLYKITILGEKSKDKGKEAFKALGYFGSMEHLVNKLLDYEISSSNLNELNEILNRIDDFKKEILSCLKESD